MVTGLIGTFSCKSDTFSPLGCNSIETKATSALKKSLMNCETIYAAILSINEKQSWIVEERLKQTECVYVLHCLYTLMAMTC